MKPLTFALIGDIQYADRDSWNGRNYRAGLELLRKTVDILNTRDVDFCISLGDLGDGIDRAEIPAVLAELKKLRMPLFFAVGNHDLVLRNREELGKLLGRESFFYDFKTGNTRMIFIDSLDVSRFSEPGPNLQQSRAFRKSHEFLLLRDWDGMLSDAGNAKLEQMLSAAEQANEDIVLISHVPIYPLASSENAWMWDSRELLTRLDRYSHLRAVFAGHYHPGGLALRNGVVHKTVRAICGASQPTALLVRMEPDRIEFEAVGDEQNGVFPRNRVPVVVSGRAMPNAYVMAVTGEMTRAGENGDFRLELPFAGLYAFRAVADGFADAVLGEVSVPTEKPLCFEQIADPGRKVYSGDVGGPAVLHITADGNPVRWFDLAGTPFGECKKPGFWYENSTAFWTRGSYAFSASSGSRVVVEKVPFHPELRTLGYCKTDFHAHLIHGENFYRGNVPLSAFIARAEHYDFLYLAEDHGNDLYLHDPLDEARSLSDETLTVKLNTEFPKNLNGHVGNLGVLPFYLSVDDTKVTNFELAEEYIFSRGGVAVPVHPLYEDGAKTDGISRMTGKEVFLWLLCAPEMTPCLDLFYHPDTPGALDFYHMLLRRGYRIGLSSTSDAAFDVGRTPGDRGCTWVHRSEATEKALCDGFRNRETVISFDGAVVLPEVDGKGPGGILAPGKHTIKWRLFYRPRAELELRSFHNGEPDIRELVRFDENGRSELEVTREWNGNGFLTTVLNRPGKPEFVLSAASAIYFRDAAFRAPEVLPFPRPVPAWLSARLRSLSIEELMSERTFDELAETLKKG